MDPRRAFEDFSSKMGINKSDGGIIDTSGVNFGSLIPTPLVEQLISLTRAQNQWLGAIDTRTRGRASGTIPVTDWNEPVTEGVGENDGTKVTTKPLTWTVPYACKKFKSEFYVTYEELREAMEAGIENFEQKMLADWTTALGNDIADLCINGDKTLPASSRRNRLLRMVDGLHKQTISRANVYNATGTAFGMGIFASMLDYMPDRFINDGGLKWMFNRRINNIWHNSLTNVSTTEKMRSSLGDQALTSPQEVYPLGIQQLIVNQMSKTSGPTAIAPTSVAAESTTGCNLVLTTLVTAAYVATAAAGVGRRFLVTNVVTGQTEVVIGTLDTTLRAVTTTKLGQETVSTSAADYLVTLADETDLYLMNPKAAVLVYCKEWRSFREYNKDYDRFEVTTYFEADFLVPIPDVIVRYTRVKAPSITTW
jgi:hypothetical protein